LNEDDLRAIAWQALADEERGYGQLKVNLTEEALDHLVNVANGDARAVLNAIELATETTPPDEYGVINITTEVAEESIQRRAVLYDKDGDAHFDTISAFIKSLRGSDPDAALYWLAKMVYAGEDPRFIFRRMIIFAGEDVGLADPNALRVVVSAAQAFDYVGMPEGRFHLTEACLYLATAPKSNSTMAFFDALSAVEQEREAEVPNHLRDSSRDAQDFGHGAGYLYPHAYRDHWVAQQYLPDSLQGRVFYQPGEKGYEATIQAQVSQRREEQLAAMLETELLPTGEVEKVGKGPPTQNRWLQRTLSNVGQQLGQIRDKVFALAKVERHDLVLDLNAGAGLLTWEAVRRTPAGGVWALTPDQQTAEALNQRADNLAELERPVILTGMVTDLPRLIEAALAGQTNSLSYTEPADSSSHTAPADSSPHTEPANSLSHTEPANSLCYDVIIGRNVFTRLADKRATTETISDLLKPEGRLALAETVPQHTQRLHKLVDLASLTAELVERVVAAEEAIYTNPADEMVNWAGSDLERIFEEVGLSQIEIAEERLTSQFRIGPEQIARWFNQNVEDDRPSFAQHLLKETSGASVTPEELSELKQLFERQLLGQVVSWQSTLVYVVTRKM
jgi:putative ATPase